MTTIDFVRFATINKEKRCVLTIGNVVAYSLSSGEIIEDEVSPDLEKWIVVVIGSFDIEKDGIVKRVNINESVSILGGSKITLKGLDEINKAYAHYPPIEKQSFCLVV